MSAHIWGIAGSVLAVIAFASSTLTAILAHKRQGEVVSVEEFKAKTDEFRAITDGLTERVGDLKEALSTEREEHEKTRQYLRISVRYNRDLVVWGTGDRKEPMPVTPDELLDHII